MCCFRWSWIVFGCICGGGGWIWLLFDYYDGGNGFSCVWYYFWGDWECLWKDDVWIWWIDVISVVDESFDSYFVLISCWYLGLFVDCEFVWLIKSDCWMFGCCFFGNFLLCWFFWGFLFGNEFWLNLSVLFLEEVSIVGCFWLVFCFVVLGFVVLDNWEIVVDGEVKGFFVKDYGFFFVEVLVFDLL